MNIYKQLKLNDLLSEQEKIKGILSKDSNELDDFEKRINNLHSITQGKDKDTNIADINNEIYLYENSHNRLNEVIDTHNLTIINNKEEIFALESLISNNNEDLKELSLVKEFEEFLNLSTKFSLILILKSTERKRTSIVSTQFYQ